MIFAEGQNSGFRGPVQSANFPVYFRKISPNRVIYAECPRISTGNEKSGNAATEIRRPEDHNNVSRTTNEKVIFAINIDERPTVVMKPGIVDDELHEVLHRALAGFRR